MSAREKESRRRPSGASREGALVESEPAKEEAGVTFDEQQVIDREQLAQSSTGAQGYHPAGQNRPAGAREDCGGVDERAARTTLRAQIARLERERSAIVAERFPHVRAPLGPIGAEAERSAPTLLDLGALERVRDQLAADLQQLDAKVRERVEREHWAREQLQRMQLNPRAYKFARLPVRDLGQGVCGVWEVRPRLGLIGMLGGWWQLKLSSGCPLAMGSRSTRDPDSRP